MSENWREFWMRYALVAPLNKIRDHDCIIQNREVCLPHQPYVNVDEGDISTN